MFLRHFFFLKLPGSYFTFSRPLRFADEVVVFIFCIWGRWRWGCYYVRKGRKAQGKYSHLSDWSQHPASRVHEAVCDITTVKWNLKKKNQCLMEPKSVPTCLSHFTALTLPLRGCCWFSSSTDPHTHTHYSLTSPLAPTWKKGHRYIIFKPPLLFFFTYSFPRSQWGQIKACQAGGVTAAAGPSRQRPCDLNQ